MQRSVSLAIPEKIEGVTKWRRKNEDRLEELTGRNVLILGRRGAVNV